LRPAIELDGVGNRVSNNLIHDAPHMAIFVNGNDQIIEGTEIHHVCLETSDAGAIYGGRDFSQRGWTIRNNYFHDLAPVGGKGGYRHVMGIYLDDGIGGETITGNLFVDVDRGVMIHGGGDNLVERNTFVRCRSAVTILGQELSKNGPILMQRLAAVRPELPPYRTRYPELSRYVNAREAYRNNVVSQNVVAGGNLLDNDLVDAIRLDSNFQNAELEAPERGDYRPKSGSPAARIGIKAPRPDEVGPRITRP
jgi:hypothetical protein